MYIVVVSVRAVPTESGKYAFDRGDDFRHGSRKIPTRSVRFSAEQHREEFNKRVNLGFAAFPERLYHFTGGFYHLVDGVTKIPYRAFQLSVDHHNRIIDKRVDFSGTVFPERFYNVADSDDYVVHLRSEVECGATHSSVDNQRRKSDQRIYFFGAVFPEHLDHCADGNDKVVHLRPEIQQRSSEFTVDNQNAERDKRVDLGRTVFPESLYHFACGNDHVVHKNSEIPARFYDLSVKHENDKILYRLDLSDVIRHACLQHARQRFHNRIEGDLRRIGAERVDCGFGIQSVDFVAELIYRIFDIAFGVIATDNSEEFGNFNDFRVVVQTKTVNLPVYNVLDEVDYMIDFIDVIGSRLFSDVTERVDDIVYAEPHSVRNERIYRGNAVVFFVRVQSCKFVAQLTYHVKSGTFGNEFSGNRFGEVCYFGNFGIVVKTESVQFTVENVTSEIDDRSGHTVDIAGVTAALRNKSDERAGYAYVLFYILADGVASAARDIFNEFGNGS